MEKMGCILVSWSFDKKSNLVMVGKRNDKKDIDILNHFEGEEAKEIIKKLTTKSQTSETK